MESQNVPVDDNLFAKPLSSLPVFAQALIASRLARRAAKAMLNANDRELALGACDELEVISKIGGGASLDHPFVRTILGIHQTSRNEVALSALHSAIEAVAAAKAASLSSDATCVTFFVQKCIDAICNDPRISRMQLAIILRSDIDQMRFACAEASIARYAALTDHVIGRLVPCHSLPLFESSRSLEDEYR